MNASTVLVVDPDPDSRTILTMFLSHAGYEVHQAADANHALDLARRYRPEAIVGEHPLRVRDGRTLCVALRDDPRTTGVPFVALTANALPVDLEEAALTHELVFIKPASIRELLCAISKIVERTAQYR